MNENQTLPATIVTYRLKRPKLDVLYPAVSGLRNPAAQQKINAEIARTVHELNRQQGYPQNPLTEITGTYEIKTNERGVLSLSLYNYAYSGGAHGNTINRSLTFDTNTGRLYRLQDLFKPGADYVKILSDIVAVQIQARKLPTLEPFASIRPDQDFYIADKSLVIYFQLYELLPYVYGFPYFPISVYSIEPIVNEEGPLGKMLSSIPL
ncbi:DUF3298 and DUF4163 domain-containing protein [Paenibacillus sp. MSJ-34]|uniref:DUF3298 and DUF4163 domain-containing protein n=1 Tax=Paenibacillus sp. MSJ-34 TaxID=2841529 RepID=UPI001C1005C3|nr:DUF3298 and DUF4163 domain-containing protein [Paenibacillus sp. MSJ-34]MBU5442000.1 DUF3298 and DUF4163 domain-containing protein [Paenibacillus sp. MSJ-34]